MPKSSRGYSIKHARDTDISTTGNFTLLSRNDLAMCPGLGIALGRFFFMLYPTDLPRVGEGREGGEGVGD